MAPEEYLFTKKSLAIRNILLELHEREQGKHSMAILDAAMEEAARLLQKYADAKRHEAWHILAGSTPSVGECDVSEHTTMIDFSDPKDSIEAFVLALRAKFIPPPPESRAPQSGSQAFPMEHPASGPSLSDPSGRR